MTLFRKRPRNAGTRFQAVYAKLCEERHCRLTWVQRSREGCPTPRSRAGVNGADEAQERD